MIAKENIDQIGEIEDLKELETNLEKNQKNFEFEDTRSISNRSINYDENYEVSRKQRLNFQEIFYPKQSQIKSKGQQEDSESNKDMDMSAPIKPHNSKKIQN